MHEEVFTYRFMVLMIVICWMRRGRVGGWTGAVATSSRQKLVDNKNISREVLVHPRQAIGCSSEIAVTHLVTMVIYFGLLFCDPSNSICIVVAVVPAEFARDRIGIFIFRYVIPWWPLIMTKCLRLHPSQ